MLVRAGSHHSYIFRHFCRFISSSAGCQANEATVKPKWWDVTEDFDEVHAGIVKHLADNKSPITYSALQRLWVLAQRPEDVEAAMKLLERQHIQRAHHGQHKPFPEDLSCIALQVSLVKGNPQLAAEMLLRRYRLGLSVGMTQHWQEVIKASYQAGDLEVPHKLWRAMPKNKVSIETLQLLVDGCLAAERPDLAKGYVLEYRLNGLTVPEELASKVDAGASQDTEDATATDVADSGTKSS